MTELMRALDIVVVGGLNTDYVVKGERLRVPAVALALRLAKETGVSTVLDPAPEADQR
jgi:hypothetical protein